MRISYDEMKTQLKNILVKKGFDEKRAEESAKNFADSSLDGVYSHGYQRFPRVIDYIQKGYIDVNAMPEKITGFGAVERWDGHLGMGNLNAKMAMQSTVYRYWKDTVCRNVLRSSVIIHRTTISRVLSEDHLKMWR